VFSKDKQQLAKALPRVTAPTENAHQFKNLDGDPQGPWRGVIKAGRTREHRYEIEDYTTNQFVMPKYGWRHPPKSESGTSRSFIGSTTELLLSKFLTS
jgi:hypothetical protein